VGFDFPREVTLIPPHPCFRGARLL